MQIFIFSEYPDSYFKKTDDFVRGSILIIKGWRVSSIDF